MARRRTAPMLEVPALEPMSLEDRMQELLDAILIGADLTLVRGNAAGLTEVTHDFSRRLDLATLGPLPLAALRGEAVMAYLLAVHLAGTVLQAVIADGGSVTDAVRALVDGAKP
jgi:hypothetical protein